MDKIEQLGKLIDALDNQLSASDFEQAFTLVIQVVADSKEALESHISQEVKTALDGLATKIDKLQAKSAVDAKDAVSLLKKDVQKVIGDCRSAIKDAENAKTIAENIQAPEVDYSKVEQIAHSVLPEEITAEEIRDKLESLDEPEKLPISAIKGLTEELAKKSKSQTMFVGGSNSGSGSNVTHTGEVTGATTLTVDKTAITNKTEVTAALGDRVLISDASDSGNLKKVTVQTIVDLASGSGVSESLAIAYAVSL